MAPLRRLASPDGKHPVQRAFPGDGASGREDAYTQGRGIARPRKANGKKNKEYEDHLAEDPTPEGQNYLVVSFMDPEDVVRDRHLWDFAKFVENWEFAKTVNMFQEFLSFLAMKHAIRAEVIHADFAEFVKSEVPRLRGECTVYDDFAQFMESQWKELDKQYFEEFPFQTCVRGFKAYSVWETEKVARDVSDELRERHQNINVSVVQMGVWAPCNLADYRNNDVNYNIDELNQLTAEHKKNEHRAKSAFDDRVQQSRQRMSEENAARSAQYGGKRYQNYDPVTGQLVDQVVTNKAAVDEQGNPFAVAPQPVAFAAGGGTGVDGDGGMDFEAMQRSLQTIYDTSTVVDGSSGLRDPMIDKLRGFHESGQWAMAAQAPVLPGSTDDEAEDN
jgi:hypothetical protein